MEEGIICGDFPCKKLEAKDGECPKEESQWEQHKRLQAEHEELKREYEDLKKEHEEFEKQANE